MRQTAALTAAPMPLSILYWDIAGSCALLSALKLETYCQVIRACQDQAAAAIEAHGGFVARYMGDAVLAYFGYPDPAGDDAERAVRAALATKLRVTHEGITIRSRIAIASGPVISGPPIGRHSAREFPAFGQAPSLAARLVGITPPGQIAIDDATAAGLAGRFGVSPVDGLALKGFPHIRRCWRVGPAFARPFANVIQLRPAPPCRRVPACEAA